MKGQCFYSNVIFRTVVQQLTRFQLTWGVERSLCDGWATCSSITCGWLVREPMRGNWACLFVGCMQSWSPNQQCHWAGLAALALSLSGPPGPLLIHRLTVDGMDVEPFTPAHWYQPVASVNHRAFTNDTGRFNWYCTCVSKNVPPLTSYNLDIPDPITVISGRSVTKMVRNQMMLCFLTSPI